MLDTFDVGTDFTVTDAELLALTHEVPWAAHQGRPNNSTTLRAVYDGLKEPTVYDQTVTATGINPAVTL